MHEENIVVIDHLYGAISIPEWLRAVVGSPEVQRLRQVRLINTSSPSCPALSDVRRFTHSLGVLNLALTANKSNHDSMSYEESRAFLVAALLHDIGTAAFGHLFEYQLAALKGWDHEKFVSDIIKGTYSVEKRYHQIYSSKELRLHSVLRSLQINPDLVVSLVKGEGIAGGMLAGSVDLDNIDGVFRMAALLGLEPDLRVPEALVGSIKLTPTGLVFHERALPLLEAWRNFRKEVYEFLAFDESCLSGQAMLTDCITLALNKDLLLEDHWYFTDEELLSHLLGLEETKETIQRFSTGDFYQTVFLGWYSCPKGAIDLRHPQHRNQLAQDLRTRTDRPCSPYVFYDSGTFSKNLRLTFEASDSSQASRVVSSKSESTIVAVFTKNRISASEQRKMFDMVAHQLEDYGLPSTCLRQIPEKLERYEIPGQRKIPFTAQAN